MEYCTDLADGALRLARAKTHPPEPAFGCECRPGRMRAPYFSEAQSRLSTKNLGFFQTLNVAELGR